MERVTHPVRDMGGNQVGSVELRADLFAAELQPHLVHDTVRWQLAKRRAGTHATLSRSMMKGSGKKPFKQKGTGNARAGSMISPLWVGGAIVFGPQPRKYGYRLPRRTRAQALRSVLSDKVARGELVVIDSLSGVTGKTKEFVAVLEKLGLEASGSGRAFSALIAVNNCGSSCDHSEATGGNVDARMVVRAARNLPGVLVMPVDGLNCHDLMRHRYLVVTKDCISKIEERMAV